MTIIRKVSPGAVAAAATPSAATGEDPREVTVIVSDEQIGRDDLVLVTAGIELENYRQNPVVLAQHEQDWPVARAVEIGPDAQNRLVARVKFPPAGVSARADEMLGLVRAGVINAVSSGFDVLQAEPLDPKRPDGGIRITRSELQEFSFVSVPALPSALVTARGADAGKAIEEIRQMAMRRPTGARRGALPHKTSLPFHIVARAERARRDLALDAGGRHSLQFHRLNAERVRRDLDLALERAR